jgi:hypothetical protein
MAPETRLVSASASALVKCSSRKKDTLSMSACGVTVWHCMSLVMFVQQMSRSVPEAVSTVDNARLAVER